MSCGTLNAVYQAFGYCPAPLLPTTLSSEGVGTPEGCPCQLPCRSQMYDEDDYDKLDTFFLVMTVISFILISYTLASVMLTEKKRTKKMVILLVASSWMLSFPVLVQMMDGGDDALCKDAITPNTQEDGGTCLYTAIMIAYFALTMAFWWFCNIVHLFLRVGALDDFCKSSSNRPKSSSRGSTQYESYWLYYSAIAFGVPLICVIALASADTFGYYGPLPYCFTTPTNEEVTWVFFHGLVMTLYFIGVFMLVMSILKICRALRGVTTTWKQSLQIHYVPLMFITVFSLFLLCVMTFRLLVADNEDSYRSSGEEWVTCLYANWASNIANPATNCSADQSALTGTKPTCGCGTHVPDGLPLWATYMISFAVSSQGLLIFSIFGLTWDHLRDWQTFLGKIFLKDAEGSTGMKSDLELSAA